MRTFVTTLYCVDEGSTVTIKRFRLFNKGSDFPDWNFPEIRRKLKGSSTVPKGFKVFLESVC